MFLGPLRNGGREGLTYFRRRSAAMRSRRLTPGFWAVNVKMDGKPHGPGHLKGEYRFDLRSVGEKSPCHSLTRIGPISQGGEVEGWRAGLGAA
jgi:hypothetical protein